MSNDSAGIPGPSRLVAVAPGPGTALSNTAIAFTSLGLVVVATACGLLLPWLLASDDPVDQARLEAIRVASTIVVGAAGLVALWLAARRQRSTELGLQQQYETARAAERDATERRITELYTKAADQLGNEKAPVRLAGLYALERLAQDNPTQRQTIVNVLCAYLRMPYIPPAKERPTHDATQEEHDRYERRRQELQVRLTAQTILTRHLRSRDTLNFWPGLELDLSGAYLDSFDLRDTTVKQARFVRTVFHDDSDFSQAIFVEGVVFRDATFAGDASFRDATFNGESPFRDATFTEAFLP